MFFSYLSLYSKRVFIFLGTPDIKENIMKRLLTILLSVVAMLTCSLAVACDGDDNSNGGPKNLTFYVPDGAPALAVAKFINDGENFGMPDATVSYNVVSANEIGPVMMQGKGDIIVMPVNAASKLYKANAKSPYVMTAVITHGNLYIMSSDDTNSLEGLKGKVVGVIGQGLVPDLTFRAVLSDNGLLDDVVIGDTATEGKITLRYFSAAPDMIPLLKQGVISVGLLPEPAATNLTKVASNRTWTVMDLQELYDADAKAYPQAVMMVRKSVYESYKAEIDGIAQLFEANVNWVKNNTAQAVQAVNGKLPEGATSSLNANNITSTVVDNCKIFFEGSASAKASVKAYINKIIALEAQSAKAITDDFFA